MMNKLPSGISRQPTVSLTSTSVAKMVAETPAGAFPHRGPRMPTPLPGPLKPLAAEIASLYRELPRLLAEDMRGGSRW